MNNSHFKQTTNGKIKEGELPDILKDGVVFMGLTKSSAKKPQAYVTRYRRHLYKLMDEMLEPHGLSTHNHTLYQKWFQHPEETVNGAYLQRKFKNPQKWRIIVNAMYAALSETLVFAIEDVRNQIRDLKDQDERLSKYLEQYEKEVHHG